MCFSSVVRNPKKQAKTIHYNQIKLTPTGVLSSRSNFSGLIHWTKWQENFWPNYFRQREQNMTRPFGLQKVGQLDQTKITEDKPYMDKHLICYFSRCLPSAT